MKVRIRFQSPQISFDREFTGPDAETTVEEMKKELASRLGFIERQVVKAMNTLSFAQEVVDRYNKETKQSLPRPASCQEFLDQAQAIGILTFVE
jgi:hypothetical protein